MRRHGPHHGAQKSTRTGPVVCNTSWAKLLAVRINGVAIRCVLHVSAALRAPLQGPKVSWGVPVAAHPSEPGIRAGAAASDDAAVVYVLWPSARPCMRPFVARVRPDVS